MIAKLTVHGKDREEAIQRMLHAIAEYKFKSMREQETDDRAKYLA